MSHNIFGMINTNCSLAINFKIYAYDCSSDNVTLNKFDTKLNCAEIVLKADFMNVEVASLSL